MNDLAQRLIEQLPKAELHVHIEGTLEPEMMLALARRNSVTLAYATAKDAARAYHFDCLQDFLDLYYQGMSVLVTEQDFYDLARAYLQRVHQDRAVHVEIFFDPQAHMVRGISFEIVLGGLIRALDEARAQTGITSRLIMCYFRHLSEEAAFAVLDEALRHKELICAIGLDSTETGNPPGKFARVFAAARRHGFAAVAHAGEEGPVAYVAEALDALKIDRLDHGNRALEDAGLTARLAREQIPLTMCPLSNLRLKIIPNLAASPVKQALQAGLCVSVNSDDPAYFGGYLNDNFRAVTEALALAPAELIILAQNSITASFLEPSAKQQHLEAVARTAERLSDG